MPRVIGVVTSPTGAVIRDILHRIRERWPCHVVVWPVVVQGDQAAEQVRAAVEGFNALTPGGPVPRPDLVIVARGGGSVEDLWPFNDEALARAVAASAIPLISACGSRDRHHPDRLRVGSPRADPDPPPPSWRHPVYADLAAAVADYQRRLLQGGGRVVELRRARLAAAAGGLPRPGDLLAIATQRLDLAAGPPGRCVAPEPRQPSPGVAEDRRAAEAGTPGTSHPREGASSSPCCPRACPAPSSGGSRRSSDALINLDEAPAARSTPTGR